MNTYLVNTVQKVSVQVQGRISEFYKKQIDQLEHLKIVLSTSDAVRKGIELLVDKHADILRQSSKNLFGEIKQKKELTETQICQLESWAESHMSFLKQIEEKELTQELAEYFQDWSLEEIRAGVGHLYSMKKN